MSGTIIYLSGATTKIEKWIDRDPENFKNTGILLSFWDLEKRRTITMERMQFILEEENNNEQG